MTLRIKGITSIGNGGDGIRIEGPIDVQMEDVWTEGNAGKGLHVLRHAQMLDSLGLSKETDPKILAKLLVELNACPPDSKEEKVRESGILNFSTLADISTVINNILSISAAPGFLAVVADLLN